MKQVKSYRMPDDIIKALDRIEKVEGISRTRVVEDAIKHHLKLKFKGKYRV